MRLRVSQTELAAIAESGQTEDAVRLGPHARLVYRIEVAPLDPRSVVLASYALSGAIDEDHRQLAILEDETYELNFDVARFEAGGQGFDKFTPDLKEMIMKRPAEREPLEHQLAELASRHPAGTRSESAV